MVYKALIPVLMFHLNPIPHPSTYLSRSVFERHGGFDEEFHVVMDYDFWFRIIGKERFLTTDKVLSIYQFHADTISTRQMELGLREIDGIRKNTVLHILFLHAHHLPSAPILLVRKMLLGVLSGTHRTGLHTSSGEKRSAFEKQRMITNIQALRSLAAFAVLVYHTAFPLLPGNHTDFQGVAIFFVISGFIMTYITLKDNRESAPLSFFLHRTVKNCSLYWLCTFYVVAFNVYAGLKKICAAAGFPGSDWILPWNASGIFSSITDLVGTDVFQGQLADVVKSLLFVPYLNSSGIPHPCLLSGGH